MTFPRSLLRATSTRRAALLFPACLLAGMALWMSTGNPGQPSPTSEARQSPRSPAVEVPISPEVLDQIAKGANAHPLEGVREAAARDLMESAWQTDEDPALAGFSRWAQDFLEANAEDRERMAPEGAILAGTRREKLKELIAADPKRALANAIPASVKGQLPAAVSSLLETQIAGFGDLVTEYRCSEEHGDRLLVKIDGQSYDASIYGSRRNLNYYLGTSLHGIELDGRMAVLDGPARTSGDGAGSLNIGGSDYALPEGASASSVENVLTQIDAQGEKLAAALASKGLSATYSDYIYAMGDSGLSAASGYPQRRAVSHTHGGKKALILRLRASNGSYPAAETEAVFKNWSFASDGWDQRLRLTTYNKTWLDAVDITPILTLPNPESYYVYSNGTGGVTYNSDRWANDGEAAAKAAGIDVDSYYCVVVGTRAFDGGGIAWAAGDRIWVNGAYDNFAALMNHEFGHILGLPHASSWTATDGNPISNNRQNVEYGDENDPMGNGGKTFRNTYQAYFKNLSQWMPDSCVQTVVEDGTYTIYQDDGATSLDRTLALKLGRDHEIMYWLSIRGDLIQTNNLFNQNNFLNGVSIVAVTPWTNPHTLDLNNPNDGNRRNTPLALNQTWYDANADITFRTVEVGGTNPNRYAKVQITFGPLHRGGYRPLVSGGVYRLRNYHNNRYLTINNNSSNNNTRATMGDLNTTNNSQSWVAWRQADGSYRFNHQGTSQWLGVQNDSGASGASIRQYNSNTTNNSQLWNVFQTEADALFILHKGTEGRLMEMDVNTQEVHQMHTTGTNWQQWVPELIGISPGSYRILPRAAETQALTILNGAAGDGPEGVRSKWLGYSNQQWTVSTLDNGRIRLTPGHLSNKALDVSNSGTADGTAIQQWTWNQSAAQRWQYSRIDGQWLRFTPDCAPNSCLDARTPAAGSGVKLWTYSGANSQQWRFADVDTSITETRFQWWARSLQLSGANATMEADPDGDGIINLQEFALGGNPSSATSRGAYYTLGTENGSYLLTGVRTGSIFSPAANGTLAAQVDAIRYEIQASYDLVDWTAEVMEATTLPAHEAPGLPEGWEYRAFKLADEASPGTGFLRMVISGS